MTQPKGVCPTRDRRIGGGSNAMGLFFPFLDDKPSNIIGVEAAAKA